MLIKYFNNKPHKTGPVWLFDLDNTLHDASFSIFKTIDQRMTEAVMESIDVDIDEAHRLRTLYWKKYGATLIGLCKHHGINAQEFLHRSHDFDIHQQVKFESNLPQLLGQLPGTLYVLTNAPCHYAEKVLQRLNIKHCFKGICAIDHMILQGYHKPKPSVALLQQVQAALKEKTGRYVLIEDTLVNLKSARQVGWSTVYIHNQGTPFGTRRRIRPPYVDYRFNNLKQLLLNPHMQQLSG